MYTFIQVFQKAVRSLIEGSNHDVATMIDRQVIPRTRKPSKVIATIGIAWLTLCIASGSSLAGVVGSKHDFSAQGWNGSGEVCVVCHTPHNSDDSVTAAPLWNHEVTIATYTVYSSSTLAGTIGQPGPSSKLCLSCHDGTVATDSFGGATGTNHITGTALIGTDLSDDHPIGITWEHKDSGNLCFNCHDVHGNPSFTSVLPFYNGKVECPTCHDPHDGPGTDVMMLRLPLANSAICFHCHDK